MEYASCEIIRQSKSNVNEHDTIIWQQDSKGVLYGKVHYTGLELKRENMLIKIKAILQLVQRKMILTNDNLMKWGWQGNTNCFFFVRFLQKLQIIYLGLLSLNVFGAKLLATIILELSLTL